MKQAHIHCESVSENVILVGDPSRARLISTMLDSAQEIAYNREYLSYRGTYKGVDITTISTGMGAPSTLICIEELIPCGAKRLIRVGSAGAYQDYIKLGELIIAEGAVRHEGGSHAYIESAFPAVSDLELSSTLKSTAKSLNIPHYSGIIRSNDSFYTEKEDEICAFWHTKGILGADMETSALLTLARLRGIQASAILNNVVLYQASASDAILNFSKSDIATKKGELDSIELALETFAQY